MLSCMGMTPGHAAEQECASCRPQIRLMMDQEFNCTGWDSQTKAAEEHLESYPNCPLFASVQSDDRSLYAWLQKALRQLSIL